MQGAHAAELVEFEDAAVQPGARFAEDHQPIEEDPDKKKHCQQKWL